MSHLLDQRARTLPDDRPAFHRLLRSMELSAGLAYMDAHSLYMKGLAAAENGTAADALRAAGVHQLDAIAQDVATLEAADQARDRINQQAKLIQLDATGAKGDGNFIPPAQVPTGSRDGRVPIDADTFAAIKEAAPKPVFQRLHAARKLRDGHYDGADGEQPWATQDAQHADAGIDLLATIKRDAKIAGSQSQAAQAGRKLDAAIAQGKTPGERRMLLDAAVSASLRSLDSAGGTVTPIGRTRQGPLVQLDSAPRTLSAGARGILERVRRQNPRTSQDARRMLMADSSASAVDATAHTEAFLALLEVD